ncbi:MAG: prolipoprotein diacylglyceryl transferase [Planctomycetota bacterium]|nr:prolipoprotein diacylglyceryl transferase [Planctomycetota bacterium]
MHPHLINIPVYVLALLGGALIAAALLGEGRRLLVVVLVAAGAGLGAGLFAYSQSWGHVAVPVQSYGTLILTGFVVGVWMAARRSRQIGVEPKHCLDLGVWGVVVGLIGARILHMLMNWPDYTPFHDGFDVSRIAKWFKIWKTGLAFQGVVITVLPFTWLFARRHKLPALPLLDMAVPSLIAGQAFGRIGCFMYGCCFGKPAAVPWAVHFPPGAPAYEAQVDEHLIPLGAPCSLGVHPTELYAALACALTAAFLYAYWPRRRYDGQIVSLTLMMTGAMRFFEELLRADEPAAFAAVPWLTTAHWLAVGIALTGLGLLFYFRQRGTLYRMAAPA